MKKSLAEAMYLADQPSQFAHFNGYQDVAVFTWKAKDLFLSLQLRAWQQQTAVNVQIGAWFFVTMIFAFYISTCVHLHVYTSTTMLLDI